MKIAYPLFERISSLVFVFESWHDFIKGKRKKKDIQCFERHIENQLFSLQNDLVTGGYQHGLYSHFYVSDPKQRLISKASVRDRLVHQILYRLLTEVFDRRFIFHSLSSRAGKGTHCGVLLLDGMIKKVSLNGTGPCYALKMDIKRFFDTINHQILKTLIRKRIQDNKVLALIDLVIDSFQANSGRWGAVGIPLGNATSQVFANIYLHELDSFIKQELREKYYLRYCDDFIILSKSKNHLRSLIALIREFISEKLQLELHPKKMTVKKLSQGIDFVGYVLFPKHTLLRTTTKKRMKKRLKAAYHAFLDGYMTELELDQRLQSYFRHFVPCQSTRSRPSPQK